MVHGAVHGIQLMPAHLVIGDALDIVAPAPGEFDSGLAALDARVHRQHWLGLGLGLGLGSGLGLGLYLGLGLRQGLRLGLGVADRARIRRSS